MTKKQLIAQGAEAKVYVDNDVVIKERVEKSYRHPILDEQLRKRRNKRETKLLSKAVEVGAHVPKVLASDKYTLEIEFLDGDKLSQTLNDYDEDKQFEVMKALGEQTSLLHENHIIHGDLTTSNTILSKNNDVFLIDFGLGFISRKIEDKAVDLHLIKQALEAKHWQNHQELFEQFLKGYKLEEKEKILQRLKAVEKRGRYRH